MDSSTERRRERQTAGDRCRERKNRERERGTERDTNR